MHEIVQERGGQPHDVSFAIHGFTTAQRDPLYPTGLSGCHTITLVRYACTPTHLDSQKVLRSSTTIFARWNTIRRKFL